MEVHHHPHVAKKNFKEYFLEFLMIFLAVTLGFFAENIREHAIERNEEKQFMKSLVDDLQKDSAMLSSNLRGGPIIVLYGDSLRFILKQMPLQGKEEKIYYYLSLFAQGLSFNFYDRTVSELKNSGSFRLIQNNAVSDAIMEYDVLIREIKEYNNIRVENLVQQDLNKQDKLFDVELVPFIRQEILDSNKTLNDIKFPYPPKLYSYNETDIKEYLNIIFHSGETDKRLLQYSEEAFSKNRLLYSLITKEYHLNK